MRPLRQLDDSAVELPIDGEPAPSEVDVCPAGFDRLPDPQARLEQEADEEPTLVGNLGEQRARLGLGQRLHPFRLAVVVPAGDPKPGRRVRPEQALVDRVGEERPHGCDRLGHTRRREPSIAQVGRVALDVARLDRDQPSVPEEGDGVTLERVPVVGPRAVAEAAAAASLVALDPLGRVVGEGDSGEGPVLPAGDVGPQRRLHVAGLGERAGGLLALTTVRIAIDDDVPGAALVNARRLRFDERARHRGQPPIGCGAGREPRRRRGVLARSTQVSRGLARHE